MTISYIKNNKYILIIAILALLSFIVGITWIVKNYYIPIFNGSEYHTFDFKLYYYAAEQFLESPDILYFNRFADDTYFYIYPPPAIILFLPLQFFSLYGAYFVFDFLAFFAYIFAIYITYKILSTQNINVPKSIFFIIAIGFGSFIQNTKYAQVNSIILLICVYALYLKTQDKPILASIFIAIGFWIKIYPIFLLPLLCNRKDKVKPLISGLIALILIPIILLPFIPYSTYQFFFTDVVSSMGESIQISLLNQSFSAGVMRIITGSENISQWMIVELPAWLSIVNSLFLIFLSLILYTLNYFDKANFILIFFLQLSIICIFTIFGWDYVYILAVPFALYVLFQETTKPLIKKIIVSSAIILLLIAKPPGSINDIIQTQLPGIVFHLFYLRYAIAIILLALVHFTTIRKKNF